MAIRKDLNEIKRYWSNCCIASSQIFLGIGAATLFTSSQVDSNRAFVVSLTLVLAVLFAMVGWRILK